MTRLPANPCALCLLAFALALGLAAPAAAAPHATWQTADFYFDGEDKPVVTGFFVNDGTDPVTVVRVVHEIFLQKGDGEYFYLAGAVWTGLDITLRPGERSTLVRLKIADYNGERHRYDRYRTRGEVTYRLFRGEDV